MQRTWTRLAVIAPSPPPNPHIPVPRPNPTTRLNRSCPHHCSHHNHSHNRSCLRHTHSPITSTSSTSISTSNRPPTRSAPARWSSANGPRLALLRACPRLSPTSSETEKSRRRRNSLRTRPSPCGNQRKRGERGMRQLRETGRRRRETGLSGRGWWLKETDSSANAKGPRGPKGRGSKGKGSR